MRRTRNAKIIATLGPSTSEPAIIERLFMAGTDVFRLNFSHGSHADHQARLETIREVEAHTGRPIAVLVDLQGPKLRVGQFAEERIELTPGQIFELDLDPTPGCEQRVELPHPEVFEVLAPDTTLLLDDGRLRLKVVSVGHRGATTRVEVGGSLSNNKGVNVPGVLLPVSPFTDKDRRDLAFGLKLGADWVAASFIQRPEDLRELRELAGTEALIMTKLEKPAALERLSGIIENSDGVMVARGDLGVELPPEQVPRIQKRIVRECREAGKPVVVATQMLESMVSSPTPTRAEASDVATAIYDGADAVMLSAETAVGKHPVEAVAMMDRIIQEVEQDSHYRKVINANLPTPDASCADAVCNALRNVVHTLPVVATVTFTSSGFSGLRAARERPESPILSLTPWLSTARRLSLVWGIHSVQSPDIREVQEMVDNANRTALEEGFAQIGDTLVIMAGMPFGVSGTTNMLRVASVEPPQPQGEAPKTEKNEKAPQPA